MRYLLLTLVLVGCVAPKHLTGVKMPFQYSHLIYEGVGCAELYWHKYPLPKPVVSEIVTEKNALHCPGIDSNKLLGCYNTVTGSIYLRVGERFEAGIIATMAHEWSHAIWAPYSGMDPTHDVNWRAVCQ